MVDGMTASRREGLVGVERAAEVMCRLAGTARSMRVYVRRITGDTPYVYRVKMLKEAVV